VLYDIRKSSLPQEEARILPRILTISTENWRGHCVEETKFLAIRWIIVLDIGVTYEFFLKSAQKRSIAKVLGVRRYHMRVVCRLCFLCLLFMKLWFLRFPWEETNVYADDSSLWMYWKYFYPTQYTLCERCPGNV